jgi:hypothetical protein
MLWDKVNCLSPVIKQIALKWEVREFLGRKYVEYVNCSKREAKLQSDKTEAVLPL